MFGRFFKIPLVRWVPRRLAWIIKSWLRTGKNRSSPPEVILRKDVLKICSKFTREHPCWSAISINLQSNFIEITLWRGCSPVNLLHIFRILFPKKTAGWLLLWKLSNTFETYESISSFAWCLMQLGKIVAEFLLFFTRNALTL